VAQIGTLYIDGVAVAQAPWTSLSDNSQYPWLIGGAPDYWNSARNFSGNIAQAAFFTNALTAAQVDSLYAAAGSAPATVAVLINTITNNEGGNTNIAATAAGSPPLSLQWYYIDTNSTTLALAGATGPTLDFTNLSFALNGDQYFLVASNAYGTATSAPVTLTVVQGPPIIQTDVSPLLSQLPVGVPDEFSIGVSGSQPFFYHWYLNSSPVPGATNSTYTFNATAGTNTYSVIVSNAFGPATSSVATVIGAVGAPPIIGFGDGSLWTLNSSGGAGSAYPVFVTGGGLQLTDGNGGEAASSFYVYPQYIGGFVASFSYVEAAGGSPLADGTTFIVENDPTGTNALGGGGGDLGIYGINNSAAFEINIYSGANGGVGLGYGIDGATPDSPVPTVPYVTSGTVNLASGDVINVWLVFIDGVLHVNLADPTTGATYSGSHNFGDLTPVLGGASGYIGFTGSTGGSDSIQTVSNFQFSYTTPPILSLAASNSSAVISWPISVATLFKLQASAVVTGPYTNVTATPTVANGENQVTVPATGSAQFFRLTVP
jgi:hypothetical protein